MMTNEHGGVYGFRMYGVHNMCMLCTEIGLVGTGHFLSWEM